MAEIDQPLLDNASASTSSLPDNMGGGLLVLIGWNRQRRGVPNRTGGPSLPGPTNPQGWGISVIESGEYSVIPTRLTLNHSYLSRPGAPAKLTTRHSAS